MDDVELWELASRAREEVRAEVLTRLASDTAQRERVEALLAQPAPRREEGPRYDILGLIGAGTQGEVYRARRLDLDREVALKVLRNVSDPAFVERVRAEAGLMARVLSPNVVTVFDAGDLGDGRYFIEMALCAEPDAAGAPGEIALGRSLRTLVVERGPLGPDEAARLLAPVCAAVAAAHRAGVVHSDVKPENVLVLPASRRAMLADFGVAASVAAPGTAPRASVGTLPYLAPELLAGDRAPDAASDAYGLGGTLLFALTGSPPHPERQPDGTDPRGGVPVALPGAVPRSLAEVVERALAADPAARPTADALAGALDAYLERRPTAWELRRPGRRLALFYQRHRVLLNLAFAGAVVAATLGMGLLRTVVAKTGLESRAAELSAGVAALTGDVERLQVERAALDGELARMRGEREALAGAEAQEREARLRAEGRSAEAGAQLAASAAAARELAGRLERSQAATSAAEARTADVEARLRRLEARAQALERDLAQREAALRGEAERYRASVEALRQGWATEGDLLRREAARSAAAAAESDRQRGAAAAAQAEAVARAEGRFEACRADRDDARQKLDEARAQAEALRSQLARAPEARGGARADAAQPAQPPAVDGAARGAARGH